MRILHKYHIKRAAAVIPVWVAASSRLGLPMISKAMPALWLPASAMACSLERRLDARAISESAKKPETNISRTKIQKAFMLTVLLLKCEAKWRGVQFTKGMPVWVFGWIWRIGQNEALGYNKRLREH